MSSLHRIFALSKYFVVLAIAISLSSCYNEPEFIGENLIPAGDITSVKTDTTFVLSAYTLSYDTVVYEEITPYGVLGYLENSIFGSTKADFLSQVYPQKLRGETALFGSSPLPDSANLTFAFLKSYGNTLSPINVKLYEIKDSISAWTDYNSLASVDGMYNTTLLSSAVYTGDSVLKFNLSPSFAQRFLDADSASMSSSKNFRSFFYGFYITSDIVSNGPLYVLDFNNANSRFKIYYHQQDTAHKDTTFTYYMGGGRFNHFENNFSAASPTYKINHLNDTIFQDSVFYLSGLGGTYGRVKLNDIQKWADKAPIAINRAELRIEFEDYTGLPLDTLVSNLYYYTKDLDGNKITITDQNIRKMNSAYYYKAKKYFSTDITLYLQEKINGQSKNKDLYFETVNSFILPSYAVLRSGAHSKRMKLILTYSKL